MKRSAQQLLVLVAVVFGGLFFGAFHAQAAIEQTATTSVSGSGGIVNSFGHYMWVQGLGRSLSGTATGTISVWPGSDVAGHPTFKAFLCQYNDEASTTNASAIESCDINGSAVVMCTDNSAYTANHEATTAWGNCGLGTPDHFEFDPAKYYAVSIAFTDSGATMYGSSNSLAYRTATEDVNPWSYDVIHDFFFSLNGGNPAGPAQIFMQFPGILTAAASSTPFSDFSGWQVLLEGGYAPNASVVVAYDKDPSKLFTGNEYGDDSRIGTVAPLVGVSDVLKSRTLTPGKWYAQANYIDVNSFVSSFSPTISFYVASSSGIFPPGISPTSSPVYNPPLGNGGLYGTLFATSTEDCSSYTLSLFSSTTLPGIACVVRQSFYNTMSWLFIVPPGAHDFFKSAVNFTDVVPFNIIFGVKDRISVAGTWLVTSSTPVVGTIGVTPPGGTYIPLITSSTLFNSLQGGPCDTTCANDAIANIKLYGNTAIWIGTALGVIMLFL